MIDFSAMRGASFAPMAGFSDLAARTIMAQHGAVFTVSEMVSAKAITFQDAKSHKLISGSSGGAPYGIQLFGAEPETMARAAAACMRHNPDFIDINMGCPAPKIVAGGAGSALMKDPCLCGEIVAAVKQAVPVPVTVKMRSGWDLNSITCTQVAKQCEQAGAALIVVHGRTREQMYTPPVDYAPIVAVRQAVSVPVFGNGDILTADDALTMMQKTGCSGVAVGRGALGNPWLFEQIAAALRNETPPAPPTLTQKMVLLKHQIYLMCEEKGEESAMRQARGQSIYFMKGLRGASELRHKCCALSRYQDVDELVALVYRYNPV